MINTRIDCQKYRFCKLWPQKTETKTKTKGDENMDHGKK